MTNGTKRHMTRVNTRPEDRSRLDALTRRSGVSISELMRRLIEAEYQRVFLETAV